MHNIPITHPYKHDIAQKFSHVASLYDDTAFLQQEVGKRLIERLAYIKMIPNTILDLGCGTGFQAAALSQQYPNATQWNLDLAPGMVRVAKQNQRSSKQLYLCADAESLPFKNKSVDFIFSNCALPWFSDPIRAFEEIQRVLKPGGFLFLSTFGPDTLKELRACFLENPQIKSEEAFQDLHNLGDQLLQMGFWDPIIDMEMLTFTYEHATTLFRDLALTGVDALIPERVDDKNRTQIIEAYEKHRSREGLLPATFEIVYAHAWIAPDAPPIDTQGDRKTIPIYQQ